MNSLAKIDIKVLFTCDHDPVAKKDPPRVRRLTINKLMGFSEFVNMIALEFGHSSCPYWGGFKFWFIWTDPDKFIWNKWNKVEGESEKMFNLVMKKMKPGPVHKIECKCA